MPTLNGKVALVTGAARGIGAAIARQLAADGAKVVVNYARSQDAAEQVVADIRNADGEAAAVGADLGEPDGVDKLLDGAAAAFGDRLDVLVNNAGVFFLKPLTESTAADLDRMLEVNVRAVFRLTREAAQRMNEGGRVITIGSVNADRMPVAGGSLYAASKAALQGFTRGWAHDLAPRGITANLVQPGPVDTDMNPADPQRNPMADALSQMLPLRRYGQPQEIAQLVALLAGPHSSYITGAILDVDGGFKA